jgi:hypothetical protein
LIALLLCAATVHADDARTVAPAKATPAKVTFTEHIAPIVFGRCTECHRAGEPAPFALQNYRDVRKRAKMIRKVTKSRFMPPWHPVPGHGDFTDSRRLSSEQIALIDAWIESGMEEGPADKLPKLPKFPDGWALGEPDLVVSMSDAYEVPAGGPDIYRNFALPLDLDEDKWVTAVEVRPSARSVVHHVLFFLDDSGSARKNDGRSGKPGFSGMGFRRSGSLGGWAVGGTPRKLPLNLARPLPKGSDLVLSSHFHPSGKAEHEKTMIGLHFAKKAPERTITRFQIPPVYGRFAGLDVPAGKDNFKIGGTFTVPVDMELVTASGHAHYICRKMNAVATLPSGEKIPLFRIDDWDFNWQGSYTYKKPLLLPKGTVIKADLIYDNSEKNPRNPFSPPKRVRWGLQSTDEMGSVIFGVVAARESEYRELRQGIKDEQRNGARGSRGGGRSGGTGILGQLQRLDKNGDGKIERSEVPERYRRIFDRLDPNKDGVIDEDEIDNAGGGGGGGRRERGRDRGSRREREGDET